MTDTSQWIGSLGFVIRHAFDHKLTSDVDDEFLLSRFFRGIDWFDYLALGPKLSIKLFDNQTESWAWLSSPVIIKSFEMFDWLKSFDYFVLQNVYSQIKQTRLKPLTKSISQPPPPNPFSYQPPANRSLLAFPVCVIIIGEESFVITSRLRARVRHQKRQLLAGWLSLATSKLKAHDELFEAGSHGSSDSSCSKT